MQEARAAAEQAARESYGRLVAYLAVRWNNLADVEDALGEAFQSALAQWPSEGVPDKPEAWILAAARRKLIDRGRRQAVRSSAEPALMHSQSLLQEDSAMPQDVIPDERLKLMFVCAHPAIDASVRTPLMLQTVLGLEASRIAPAFLTAPSAMAQRLVRAKAKIRDAGIPFVVPASDELPERLRSVLDAIYVAFGSGWADVPGTALHAESLDQEAIWLARVLLHLMPEEPEVKGLLALMLFCESRREARGVLKGCYVPFDEQDTKLWSRPRIAEAERLLFDAARSRKLGRFQLEAAIQSAHTERMRTGLDNRDVVVQLYDGLIALEPAMGARVGRAAALAEARGPQAGLEALDALTGAEDYQPYWALRAHLHSKLGEAAEAVRAYDRAIGLTDAEAVRRFLQSRRALVATLV
jgi:predicted RNA polymerase sigma factor